MKNYLADLYLKEYSCSDKIVEIQERLSCIFIQCSEHEIVEVTTKIFRAIECLMDSIVWAPWPMEFSAKEIYEENSGLSHSPLWRNSLESAFFDLCNLQDVAEGLQGDVRFPAAPHVAAACLASEIITQSVHAVRTLAWAKTAPEQAQQEIKEACEYYTTKNSVEHFFVAVNKAV